MFIKHFSKPSHHPIWYPEWTFRVNPKNQIPTQREIRYVYIKIVLCGFEKKKPFFFTQISPKKWYDKKKTRDKNHAHD